MNIILFTRRRNGTSNQHDLTKPHLMTGVIAGVALIAGAVFLSGFLYAANKHQVDPDQQVLLLHSELKAKQRELLTTREEAHENLEALAVRIGQMQAHVIRLDALGNRLTAMADLQDGEFDFTSPPPRGGPELKLDQVEMDTKEFLSGLNDLEHLLQDRDKQLGVLESLMLSKNLEEDIHPAGRPVASGWISSFYGTRRDPFTGHRARHDGVDFAGRAGVEITAVGTGVVSWSSDRFGYGNMVEITHGNGYRTRYAHNQANLVKVGDKVAKGQVVALMGSTGRATGPNLHFEVLHNGRTVDPVKYINSQTH